MPLQRTDRRTLLAGAFALSMAAAGWPQDRGTLQVATTPDSAMVVLDDSRDAERQRTPYTNESMIPGTHRILLRPADPAYMPVTVPVDIQAGQTAVVEHAFEYRTKATGMELLSVSPWKVQIDAGVRWLSYVGMESSKAADASAASTNLSSYPSDSIPRSVEVPLTLRLGFPHGLEFRASVPWAGKWAPHAPGSLALGDPSVGLKWTFAPLNSAADVSCSLGSSKGRNLGNLSDALLFALVTDQSYQGFDLAANLGYSVRFNSTDTGAITPGDALLARVRAGILLADRVLPYLQAAADFRLPATRGGQTVQNATFLLTATPGLVWYAGHGASLELGVPLGLVASNEETRWGFQASLSLGLGSGGGSKLRSTRSAPSAAVPLQPVGVPFSAPSHILLASHEVTNGEYRAFCNKTGHEAPADPDFPSLPGYFTDPRYDNYPVVNVSIGDARAYAAWAGRRLPTVTEWRKAVEDLNLTGAQVACGLEAPEPVDGRPQGIGTYDLVGNVAEWVENDRSTGSVAYMAGGFYSLPRERCLDKGRWIDVASPAGGKYIGFRVLTEVK
jgi:hypothetical protein